MSFEAAEVERAVVGLKLRLPRGPHRGRSGESRAASVGSSVELHDFRTYQPGDDLRQIDWNAVARTGDLVLRVRQEEVSPRCEVIVDGSASMAVSPTKATRTREVTYAACLLARQAGLEVSLIGTGLELRRHSGLEAAPALLRMSLEGRVPFEVALGQLPAPRPCGVRVVVSDFLFESEPATLADRFARGAAQVIFLQVLDVADAQPSLLGGARLTDAESGEAVDRTLTAVDLARYDERLGSHVSAWRAAAARAHGVFLQLVSDQALEHVIRHELAAVVEAGSR